MNTRSAERLPGREHIPIYPRHFIAVRITQMILAIVVLALSAFVVYYIAFDGAALMLFVSVATIIVTTWLLITHFSSPKFYNYWAVLVMDIFCVIFWLVALALVADRAALLLRSITRYCDTWIACTDLDYAVSSSMAASAGLGGLQFILFITSLSIHGVALHRHRKAGLPNKPVQEIAPIPLAPGVMNPSPGPEKNGSVSTAPNPAYGGPPMPPHNHFQAPYDPNMNRTASPPAAGYYPHGVQQPQPYYPYPQQPSPVLTAQYPAGGSYPQTPPPMGSGPEQAPIPVHPQPREMTGQQTYQQHQQQ